MFSVGMDVDTFVSFSIVIYFIIIWLYAGNYILLLIQLVSLVHKVNKLPHELVWFVFKKKKLLGKSYITWNPLWFQM